jgi:cell division protein FtsQ
MEHIYRASGLVVCDVNVDKQLILHNIKVKKGDVMFAFSADDIFRDVKSNLWVKNLVVHKSFPNKISISVSYKKAVAVFQENSKFTLIDENGEDIESIDIKKLKDNIPIVTGDSARKEFWKLMNLISTYLTIKKKLNSIAYIRERRWDIIVSGGITVRLPEGDVRGALESLELLLRQPNINRNTTQIIDMRVKDKIIFSGSKLEPSGAKDKKTV